MIIAICSIVLLLIFLAVLTVRFRRSLSKKKEALLQSIREEGRLMNELKRTNIEKATLEKLLITKKEDENVTLHEYPEKNNHRQE